MDDTDQEILDILKQDGRASYTDIAEQVGVSEGTVRNRVEGLREEDVISRFTVETGTGLMKGFVMVDLSTDHTIDSVVEKVGGVKIYELAGRHDAIVLVEGADSDEVNQKVDEIRAVEGVDSTETYLVLNELEQV